MPQTEATIETGFKNWTAFVLQELDPDSLCFRYISLCVSTEPCPKLVMIIHKLFVKGFQPHADQSDILEHLQHGMHTMKLRCHTVHCGHGQNDEVRQQHTCVAKSS